MDIEDDENGWDVWHLKSRNMIFWGTEEECMEFLRGEVEDEEDAKDFATSEWKGGDIIKNYQGKELWAKINGN